MEEKGRKRHRPNMEGTGGVAEAGSHSKRPRRDRARHKHYREIRKWMFEELQLVEIDYHQKLQELAENENELERCRSELASKESQIQQQKATLESQKALMESTEQTVVHGMSHLGLNCTSFKEVEAWFVAQKYVGDAQGSATETANFQTSMVDFCQPMGLGQYHTSIAASTAAASSSSAGVWLSSAARSPFGTNDILSAYGDPNNIGNHFGSDLATGLDYTSIVAPSTAAGTSSVPPNGHGNKAGLDYTSNVASSTAACTSSVPPNSHGVWNNSDAANYDLCEFGVLNNYDVLDSDYCLCIDELDGNNHENDGGPFPPFT